MKMKQNSLPRWRLGTALSLTALSLGVLALAPSAALADSLAPTQPPAPIASSTTTTMTTLSWGSSTDNVQVTGYDLQELENGSWTTIDTLAPGHQVQEVTGLTPATTYQFAVVAFDVQGNRSARSDPTTVTTMTATQLPTCQFQLASFPPGFTAYATIINTTGGPLSNWSVSFTMPSDTSVSTIFGSTLTRTATGGTLTPFSYNATLRPGAETFVGFEGSVSPFNPPSGFTLNGQPCTSS